jgi:hypothetical protein
MPKRKKQSPTTVLANQHPTGVLANQHPTGVSNKSFQKMYEFLKRTSDLTNVFFEILPFFSHMYLAEEVNDCEHFLKKSELCFDCMSSRHKCPLSHPFTDSIAYKGKRHAIFVLGERDNTYDQKLHHLEIIVVEDKSAPFYNQSFPANVMSLAIFPDNWTLQLLLWSNIYLFLDSGTDTNPFEWDLKKCISQLTEPLHKVIATKRANIQKNITIHYPPKEIHLKNISLLLTSKARPFTMQLKIANEELPNDSEFRQPQNRKQIWELRSNFEEGMSLRLKLEFCLYQIQQNISQNYHIRAKNLLHAICNQLIRFLDGSWPIFGYGYATEPTNLFDEVGNYMLRPFFKMFPKEIVQKIKGFLFKPIYNCYLDADDRTCYGYYFQKQKYNTSMLYPYIEFSTSTQDLATTPVGTTATTPACEDSFVPSPIFTCPKNQIEWYIRTYLSSICSIADIVPSSHWIFDFDRGKKQKTPVTSSYMAYDLQLDKKRKQLQQQNSSSTSSSSTSSSTSAESYSICKDENQNYKNHDCASLGSLYCVLPCTITMPCPSFPTNWSELPILSFSEYVLWRTLFAFHWKAALTKASGLYGKIGVFNLFPQTRVLFEVNFEQSAAITHDLRQLFSTWNPLRIFEVRQDDMRLIMDTIYLKYILLEPQTQEWMPDMMSLQWSKVADEDPLESSQELLYGNRISLFMTPCGKRLHICKKLYLAGFPALSWVDSKGRDLFDCTREIV